MKKSISPSLMCVDFMNMRETLAAFEDCGIEYLHIDIMDGKFVPNYTLGPDFAANVRKHTKIPLDFHLMVERPEDKIDWFDIRENDLVSVHYESTPHIIRALQKIRAKGAKALIALNPATPLSALDYLMDEIDGVLIMTVNPGYAGQKLIPQTLGKIRETRKLLDSAGKQSAILQVDGNVSFENARLMNECGADNFVAGSSSLFKPEYTMAEAVRLFREGIEQKN